MSARSSPSGTMNAFSGSVGFSSCTFSMPIVFTSSARCTSLDALRDSVQPGMRVSSVRAVHSGCGRKPMIWNSTGTLFSSIAFWMDAFTPRANDSKIVAPLGVVLPELLVPVAAEREQPREPVARDVVGPEHFGEPSLAVAAPHLELPHAVLRHDVALREEEVLGVLREDVRDAPAVAQHLDRLAQAEDQDRAVELRERLLRRRVVVGRPAARRLRHECGRGHDDNDSEDEADSLKHETLLKQTDPPIVADHTNARRQIRSAPALYGVRALYAM